MTPHFLIPSLVWHGLAPSVSGVGPAPGASGLDRGWGGLLAGDEDAAQVLRMLEPAVLLLNLAGYQGPEVAVGLPKGAAETKAADLVAIDMRTMRYAAATTRPWTPVGSQPASAQVAVWVEPRYPAAPPAVGTGPTLSLVALTTPLAPHGIELDFALSGAGWLRFSWPATAFTEWPAELTARVDLLTGPLAGELGVHGATAAQAPPGDEAPLCGLLGLYDARDWRVPAPLDPPFDRITPAVTQFGEHLAGLLGGQAAPGLTTFLDEEVAQPPDGPPSVTGRWAVAAGEEETRANLADLAVFGDELVAQSFEASLDPTASVLFADSAFRSFDDRTVTGTLLSAQELGVLDFLTTIGAQVAAAFPSIRYGDYDLRRGDDDATHRYGGTIRFAEDGDLLPAGAERGYVAQLRIDLAELGFGPLFKYDPTDFNLDEAFDLHLEWAVRELQLYARMPNLARASVTGAFDFYADRLEQAPNPSPYAGPVSGVANAETRLMIGTWIAEGLRCPVVIEARAKVNGEFTGKYAFPPGTPNVAWRPTDNLWRADQLKVPAGQVQMFARDFTGYWELLPESVAAGRDLGNMVIGAWTDSSFGPGPWSDAPSTRHTHVWWPESEITPESLVGQPFDALPAASRSTFRVVRAVAEVEDLAYFDSFNAYDSGFISAGPYHWTLGLSPTATTADGELPAYFAYLNGVGGEASAAFQDTFGAFGLGVTKDWPEGKWGADSPCWEPTLRKYAAWITVQDDSGSPVEAPRQGHETAEWFRQWHWFFRFSMASRTNQVFRRRMWDYARLRIRDLLDTEWHPRIALGGAGPAWATVGDLFTSERAVAVLLRWHVNAPSNLLPMDPARRPRRDPVSRLTTAFARAGAAAWGDPSTWDDTQEEAICDALFAIRPDDPPDITADPLANPPIEAKVVTNWLRESLEEVYAWPRWRTAAAPPRHWSLAAVDVLPAPAVAGLANAGTAIGVAHAMPFTVDWRGAPDTPTARSQDPAVVADAGISIAGAAPDYTLTLTPVARATGRTEITVVADSGEGRTEARFTLTAGAPAGQPAAPGSSSGLSKQRNSFRFDDVFAP